MTEILQQVPPSQYQVKIFSAGDEIKQLLRAQRPIVNRRAIDYHSAALRHIKDRIWQKNSHSVPAIQPDSLYASTVGAPSNFQSSPVNGVTTKYIKMMHNKLKSPIFCVQWDPDGRRLVTGAASGEFTLWNAINFSFEALLQAHDAPIRSMKWSHTDEWLISSDDRGLVKYWQSNMNNVHTFQAHSDPVRCLRWEDDTRQHRCYHHHQCSIVLVCNSSRRCHIICVVDCCKCCFSFLINNHHHEILIIGSTVMLY